MAFTRMIGIAFASLGAVFLIAGLSAVDTPFEELSRMVASTHTPQTMWFVTSGVAALLGGGALALAARGY